MRTAMPLVFAAIVLAVCACGDGSKEPATPGKPPARHAAGADGATHRHGHPLSLGSVRLGATEFAVLQLGAPAAGKELGFWISPAEGADLGENVSLHASLQNESGADLAPAAAASFDGKRYHVHLAAPAAKGQPARILLRLRTGELEDSAALDLAEGYGKHDGVLASFSGGDRKGRLELKLHDDKGDLELWLITEDGKSFDVPLETVIEATFLEPEDRTVQLAVRNRNRNEDENGQPNVRNGATNYFVFPGLTDEDASWLEGAEFAGTVVVRFAAGGVEYSSPPFRLFPHTHAHDAGHEHSHEHNP
ncbi:MAG: hypothetical protein JXQ29_02100 [Planctomycetes bacterium]|nr:hypothetical protein [Planctomycetota bacterium]